MTLQDTITLSNKIEMPKIALGTWLTPAEVAQDIVKEAIKLGFRHIDTAQAYNNEESVGKGIRESGIPRNEIFVTTKVAAEIKNYVGTVYSIEKSLEKLGIEYIDLLLIHAPMPWDYIHGPKRYFNENREVWKAMEKFYFEGKIKALGVSNFKKEDIKNIVENCKIEPVANQIKMHPKSSNVTLYKYLQGTNLAIQAYSPLAHGEVLNEPLLLKLGEKYGATTAQICVKYALQRKTCPVIKSLNPQHLKQFQSLDFHISEEDMNAITRLGAIRRHLNKKNC
ncbi:MAG: aldo/keto reductase [Bacteroidales bacterium]|jgi:diketogulonate reductase-like aldo/keto reductase|nr:aldo/keto reductase [Bacteroidales bacterium]